MAIITADVGREQRAKEVENSLASGRLAGLEPSAGAMAIFQRYVDGELTLEQMGSAIDKYADLAYGPVLLPGHERS